MENEKIQDLIQDLERVSELLYQDKKDEGYTILNPCIQKLSIFAGILTNEVDQIEFINLLKSALEAMEAENLTLLADIIQYDIINKIEQYEE